MTSSEIQLGRGYYWQDLKAGQRFRTLHRTVTEADLINFISCTGMLEVIFIDAEFEGAIDGRVVPGALTCCLIEGLQFQSLLQETGLAMLEMNIKALKPVCVGDRLHGIVEIVEVKPTSTRNRAVISSKVEIHNQKEHVLTYNVKRMVKGRDQSDT